jgi:hypothetical protein
VQYPSFQDSAGQMDSTVENGEAVCCTARVDKRRPEGRQDIGFTILRSCTEGQTQRDPQLTGTRIEVTDITQDDPGGLARYRSRIGTGSRR